MTPDAEAKAVASDGANSPDPAGSGHPRSAVTSHRDAKLSAGGNLNPPLSVPLPFSQRESSGLCSRAGLGAGSLRPVPSPKRGLCRCVALEPEKSLHPGEAEPALSSPLVWADAALQRGCASLGTWLGTRSSTASGAAFQTSEPAVGPARRRGC